MRLLVFSSLECALSQLSLVLPKEEKPKRKRNRIKGKEEESALQNWAIKVIPQLNQWQKIESSELEGTISYYLASEEGKFNLTDFDDEAERPEKTEKPAEGEEQQKAEQPLNYAKRK